MAKPISLLIDLDSLLDTRLPVVYTLNQELATEIIENKEYVYRKKDIFGNISNDIFKSMYKARSKAVLNLATPTAILQFLIPYLIETKSDLKNVEALNSFYIYINVYPYKFNMMELIELENAFSPMFIDNPIKMVSMDFEELTPSWVMDNVETLIMYDAIDWIEYNTANNNLVRTPLINKIIIGPALIGGTVKISDINKEFFMQISKSLGSLINYQAIDVSHFCTLLAET